MNKYVCTLLSACALGIASTAPLMAQTQTLYSTIGGTIWQDNLPFDNIRQVAEPGVAGILVSLHNAANGSLISAAISDADGEYQLQNYKGTGSYYIRFDYPYEGFNLAAERVGSDNAINSAANSSSGQTANFTIANNTAITNMGLGLQAVANTLTHCRSKSMEPTNWTHTFTFPKAPATTGNLTGVYLFATDAVRHPSIGIENTGGQVTESSMELSGRLTITVPNPGQGALVANTAFNVESTLGTYDGFTDYAGTSGISWFNNFSAAYADRNITNATHLNPYVGTGNLTMAAGAQSATTTLGGGNVENVVQTHVGGGVCVVYKFAGGILPVSLSAFTARKVQQQVAIDWTTVAELNNQGFTLERSADGIHFDPIVFVPSKAKEGKSTSQLQYHYIDNSPMMGKNLYRLKQVDIDGKYQYTKQVMVHFGTTENEVLVYPNPANNSVTVTAADTDNVELFNITGKKINAPMTRNGDVNNIDVSALPSGQYTIHIGSNKGTTVNKLTIQR